MSPVGFRVVTSVPPAHEDRYEELRQFKSSDLVDAMNRAGGMVGIRAAFMPIPPVVARAITVSVPAGGVDMIKMGIEQAQPGDVLVVTAQGATTHALWGGNLSLAAQNRGLAGFIIDGAVRDVAEIQAIGFPTFARAVATSAGQINPPTGEVNVPIACGSVVVNPGDIVVADDDGIAVIPPRWLDEVLTEAARLVKVYEGLRAQAAQGQVAQIASIKEQFVDRGLEFADTY